MWIIPLILLIAFEAVADIFSKEWSLHQLSWQWITAISFYILANVFWLFAIKNGSGLARGSVIFSIASGILGTLIGLFLYKEQIGKYELVAFVLGIGSIMFFSLGETS
jgi:multidrug transporter EmrE-like cation transporter